MNLFLHPFRDPRKDSWPVLIHRATCAGVALWFAAAMITRRGPSDRLFLIALAIMTASGVFWLAVIIAVEIVRAYRKRRS